MLNNIKLTNFRKHRDLELNLQPGLAVFRGNNEAGKTTLLLAISYLMFGLKSLPVTLEEAVTWGEPVGSLKVEGSATFDGVQYNIKRSKSGAEIVYDGGRVTGQNETVAFMCRIMGVEAAMAPKLMISSQGAIRGALEAGTKATTDLIERLAEFDQIDLLIDRMQESLTLGSATTLETQLGKAETDLEAARVAAVKPDLEGLQARLSSAQTAHQQAQKALTDLDGEVAKAQEAVDVARQAQNKFERAEETLSKARDRAEKFSSNLEAARAEANKVSAWPKDEGELTREISALEQAEKVIKDYGRLVRHLTPPAATTELHSLPGLLENIRDLHEVQRLALNVIAETKSQVEIKTAALSSGSCGFCGQDFSALPAVAEKNAKLQAEIAARVQVLDQTETRLAKVREDITNLEQIKVVSEGRLTALEANPTYLERVGTSLPPTLRWIGPDLDSLGDPDSSLDDARRLLANIRAARSAEAAADTRYETLKGQQADVDGEVAAAKQLVEIATVRPDLAAAEAQREEVLAKRRPLQAQASDSQTAARDAEYELRDAERGFTQAMQRVEHLEEGVVALKHQLTTLEFNNTLLKRVRQCRPLIADKLWGIVLNAVSSYFSEMRGVKSRVTKDADGFKVDDHIIEGLSGSTLDILGLAIRVALVRTFLPNAPFLVLDEPCAAMDATRTEATLGFVVSCGFKQVLLVTHEDTSESVADHLIQI